MRCCAAGSGCAPTAQAALAFAYEHLALRRRDALRVSSASPVVDGAGARPAGGPHGELDVTVRVDTVAADGLTCHNPRPNFYLAYHPVRIDAVPV